MAPEPAAVLPADASPWPRAVGENRALVVWARFADDDEPGPGVTEAARDWQDPSVLPTIANRVLSRDLPGAGLTRYFAEQSAGRFRLVGASYPSVVTMAEPEIAYGKTDGTVDLGRMTAEIMDQVAADPEFDLDWYDADRDGYLDYLFVVLHGMRTTRLYPSHPSGVSDLGALEPGASWRGLRLDRNASGSYVRYDNAGNIFADLDLVRLMAHEIGHDLWRGFVHLSTVEPVAGIPSFPERPIGYALMAGHSDARGDLTISAFERDLLGWIDCRPLVRDTTVVLRDLYSTDADHCLTLEAPHLGRSGASRRIYLSNRQRIGPFDWLRAETRPEAASDHGLMDTGLLVMATEGGARVGVVPADGMLVLSTQASDYEGDLFKPGARLTPWSHPNSSGYVTFPRAGLRLPPGVDPGLLYRGLHVENLSGEDGLVVRFVADERVDARFRDGDLIPPLPGLRFTGPADVSGRVELAGAAAFTDTLRVAGTLVVSGSLTVRHIELEGTLEIAGVVDAGSVNPGPTARVVATPAARLRGEAARRLLEIAR